MEEFIYYAFVGDNNKVKKCFPVMDDTEFEKLRRTIPTDLVDGRWIRVSNESKIPMRYWNYIPEKNAFCEPRPHPSWKLSDNLDWVPPVEMPNTGGMWSWDEEVRNWVPFNNN